MESFFYQTNNPRGTEVAVLYISLLASTVAVLVATMQLVVIVFATDKGKDDVGRDPYDDIVAYTFVFLVSILLSVFFVCRLCSMHDAPRFSDAIMWTSWLAVLVMVPLSAIALFLLRSSDRPVFKGDLSKSDLAKEDKKIYQRNAAWTGLFISIVVCIVGTSIGFYSRSMGI
jgi:hypothetical protein